jgi:ribosomal protein S18 acetylase RimI-like enzyme
MSVAQRPVDPKSAAAGARIRTYAPADHEAVLRLVREVLSEFGFSPQVGGLEQDLKEILERYSGGRAGFWVAEADGEVVGSVAIRPKDDLTCEIKRLYLRPDRRGSGLGQALYAHAEAFAAAAGYRRIWLDSSRRFARAHRLYEKNGFVLTARLENEWEDNVYEKALP